MFSLFLQRSEDHKSFIDRIEKEIGSELRQTWSNLPLEDWTLPNMLATINDKTGEKFVIIIDEWDAIFRNYPNDTVTQTEWIHFLRDMFKKDKSNSYLALAYVTGILPIRKYKTQSSLNNFREYSIIKPQMLEPYVGFLQEEVDDLCARYESIIRYNNENALVCVISVLCISIENQYIITRETLTGKVFADIVLLPKPKTINPAVIIDLNSNRTLVQQSIKFIIINIPIG